MGMYLNGAAVLLGAGSLQQQKVTAALHTSLHTSLGLSVSSYSNI